MTTQPEIGQRGFDDPPPSPPRAPSGAHGQPPQTVARSAAATRRTSRRTLLLSVLVIGAGGLLAFTASQMLTGQEHVLVIARDVPVGASITNDDLAVAQISHDPAVNPIRASERSSVVGQVARVGLAKGSLLTRGQFGPDAGLGNGQTLVALPLKPGQFPAQGLKPGQRVLVVATPGTGATGSNTGVSSGQGKGTEATVADVGPTNAATQLTVVDVQVAADAGISVAQLASTSNLAVLLLPGK